VLTDHGALREFTDSVSEGLAERVAELKKRTGAEIVVQFDEPTLPDVLAGALSTPSGYGTVNSVPEPDARDLLSTMIDRARLATGQPVIVHCCAPRPPIALLRGAGADALAVDATLLDGAPGTLLDEIGEAWDSGTRFLLGLVPSVDPGTRPALRDVAKPALRLVDRLGFNRSILAERAVPTPTCGFAGSTTDWMRRALALTRDLGKAFVEPPEGW
jgi:hypothetical protein